MKNIKDYLIYGVLGILFIVSIVLIFSGSGSDQKPIEDNPTKEELIIDTYKISVKVNEEERIVARVENNPQAIINYITMDNDIVSVTSDGMVKGLKPGSAYVTVSYTDTKGATQSKNCYINVTMNDSYVVESLTLPEGDLILKVNDTFKMEYQVTPANEYYVVSYQSTDPEIASIDNEGNLKGLKPGVIAIRVNVNNSHVDKLVYVTDKEYISGYTTVPTSITFKNKNMKIMLDDEVDVPYTYLPDNANLNNYATWTSSDPSIVSVNNGKIKGLALGSSDITLETVNGIKITTSVTVSPKEIKIENINITSGESVNLEVGGIHDITYEITPSDATEKIVYLSSNTKVATVNSTGKITAISEGNATISIKTEKVSKDIQVVVTKPSSGGSSSGGSSSGGSSSGGSSSGGSSGGRCKISTDPADSTYNSCFKRSHHLTVSQSSVTVKVGSSVSIKVGLPSECGTFIKYTRTSADGSSGWRNYISQSRSNIGSSGFTWIITGVKKGSTTASQTVQYDAKSPSGKCSGNVKSMITVRVTVV